jgi:hypothetical protein
MVTRNDMDHEVCNIEQKLSVFLSQHGFMQDKRKISRNSFEMVYRKGDLYIKVIGGYNVHDYPFCVNVILGEGSAEYPYCDSNAVALWQIMNKADGQTHREYNLEMLAGEDGPDTIINDLGKYAANFLKNGAL